MRRLALSTVALTALTLAVAEPANKETAFRTGCRPVAKGSYFYDVDELERCYGREGTPTP